LEHLLRTFNDETSQPLKHSRVFSLSSRQAQANSITVRKKLTKSQSKQKPINSSKKNKRKKVESSREKKARKKFRVIESFKIALFKLSLVFYFFTNSEERRKFN